MRVLLQVHTESFLLDDPAVIDRVRTDILAAVHRGGAFVRIGPTHGAPEILVTPATLVRISVIPDQPEGERELAEELDLAAWDDL